MPRRKLGLRPSRLSLTTPPSPAIPGAVDRRETEDDIRVASLDDAMRVANSGVAVALPTAIGFCMFVSREAWQAAGGLDERYGRGYGEEVEFCLATGQQGWCPLTGLRRFRLSRRRGFFWI